MTNLEAAAEAIEQWSDQIWNGTRHARAVFDAIDPRLADLTPEDTKAILDMFVKATELAAASGTNPDLVRVREILSR